MNCAYRIGEHEVYRFAMPVIRSNMFVLTDNGEALIVDPNLNKGMEQLLCVNHVKRCTILLTHEHYDHISGVNRLRELCSCEVIGTKACAAALDDPRKNAARHFAALFMERSAAELEAIKRLVDTGYSCSADTAYEGEKLLNWHDLRLCLEEAPGHSPGGQLIYVEGRYLFSGDNLIPGEKVITRMQGGDAEAFRAKTLPLLRDLPDDTVIFPGHGEEGLYGSEEMQFSLNQL